MYRFLGRAWRLVVGTAGEGKVPGNGEEGKCASPTREQLRAINLCISKVGDGGTSSGVRDYFSAILLVLGSVVFVG